MCRFPDGWTPEKTRGFILEGVKFLSYAMEQLETNRREATIEKWVYGGSGLGRVNGQTLLVPYVLPGEAVRVAVEKERRGLLEGRLLEVLAPSEGRVSPPCPHFTHCGGCHYQHA